MLLVDCRPHFRHCCNFNPVLKGLECWIILFCDDVISPEGGSQGIWGSGLQTARRDRLLQRARPFLRLSAKTAPASRASLPQRQWEQFFASRRESPSIGISRKGRRVLGMVVGFLACQQVYRLRASSQANGRVQRLAEIGRTRSRISRLERTRAEKVRFKGRAFTISLSTMSEGGSAQTDGWYAATPSRGTLPITLWQLPAYSRFNGISAL